VALKSFTGAMWTYLFNTRLTANGMTVRRPSTNDQQKIAERAIAENVIAGGQEGTEDRMTGAKKICESLV